MQNLLKTLKKILRKFQENLEENPRKLNFELILGNFEETSLKFKINFGKIEGLLLENFRRVLEYKEIFEEIVGKYKVMVLFEKCLSLTITRKKKETTT